MELIWLEVLLLTLILVEWLKLVAMTFFFFFFLLLNLMPASEVGPLTHWPAPPYAITLLKEVNQLMTGMLTAGLRIV